MPRRPARHFKIRALFNFPIGVANILLFEIWDTTNLLACRYGYVGSGIALDIPGPQALEGLKRLVTSFEALMSEECGIFEWGSWSYFSTRASVRVEDFGGPRCGFLELQHGGRGAPLGMTAREFQSADTLLGTVERYVFSPWLEFYADPFGRGRERIMVRVDIPATQDDALPAATLTRGRLIMGRGPYEKRNPY